ncbi:MAG TPA: pyridoxamine 5'-phosphate oxidase family protein [Egibacteraceae bacterium]|nr:pyridoxamine 5'-phosphate oxidase family protein [Egibacteraceae bacterium]
MVARGDGGRRLERLSVAQCLALLGPSGIGRIAFAHGPTPVIMPVNYAMDGGSLVLRTAEGTLLAAAPDGTGVALEVDRIDLDYHIGWSILLRGRMDGIRDADELARCRDLPLGVYAPGLREAWRRITPATLTGRRIA